MSDQLDVFWLITFLKLKTQLPETVKHINAKTVWKFSYASYLIFFLSSAFFFECLNSFDFIFYSSPEFSFKP